LGLFFTILLAIQFTFYQIDEYIGSYFALSDGVYGTTFYMATGLHGLHVIIGTIFLIICAIRMLFGQFTKTHHVGYEAAI
jgi:heme/copper-type cytochrome/quinol oxidase subunit 3